MAHLGPLWLLLSALLGALSPPATQQQSAHKSVGAAALHTANRSQPRCGPVVNKLGAVKSDK
jgi:hypothetical protein